MTLNSCNKINIMLYEISRKVITINKYQETTISWNNSVLVVRGNKDLHLLEFSYNLNSLYKGIDFKERTVSSTKNNPLTNDFLTQYVSHGVRNSELVEMVLNSAFWPHNNLLMQEMTNITAYEWSPHNFVNENDSLLAVLNSVGNVEIFAATKHGWTCIMDYSSQMKKYFDRIFDQLPDCPNFTEVKNAVYSLGTASICWSSNLNDVNSCYFVTAQKSGDILFWSVKYNDGNVETLLCGCIQNSNNVEIVHMLWVPRTENKFWLVCSNEYGEIVSNECEIIDKVVTLKHIHKVWSYKDKMVTTYLHYHIENDKLLLFFNKHRHLIVQMYDENFQLLSQHAQIVNDYKITSITKNKNLFYITTVNVKLYRIDYSIIKDTLNVSLNLIEMKDSYLSYELHGTAVSTNGAIFALAMISRKLLLRTQSVNIEIVLFNFDVGCDTAISTILNNPSKKLTNMWDVIETIRCKTIKMKKLPVLDYNALLKDDCDVYNLKLYLIFVQLYHNLEKNMALGIRGLLPETSIEAIKERILMYQAFSVIHNIYENFQNNPCLNGLGLESFECSKRYLYYFCKKYDKNVTNFVSEDILKICKIELKYLCQSCDEKLIDFTCKNEHVNMICSLTFTPLEDDYLLCKCCNATARIELCNQSPTCVYCDICLKNSDLLI